MQSVSARPAAFLALLLLTVFCSSSPAISQTLYEGQTANGSYYMIGIPDGWTAADGLVLWNHGYTLDPPQPRPSLGPLSEVQLAEGWAVAASSYSLNGWAVFQTEQDIEQLVDVFVTEFGLPARIVVTGASLGGLVTAQTIENPAIPNVVGALPICGAVAGSRNWDGATDLRLIYDTVCRDVPGAQLPGGLDGLPGGLETNETPLVIAAHTCTGIAFAPEFRSEAQQQRLDRILELTTLPEDFFVADMGYATYGITDIVQDPAKMNGGAPFGNALVQYRDSELNASIERVTANAADRQRFLDHYSPSGDVGNTKIISLHTDKDGLVLVENNTIYQSLVPPQNLTVAIAIEDEPTHCGFGDAEILGSWRELVDWIDGGQKPTAQTIQQRCLDLVAAGSNGPCRVDPKYELQRFESRVPARSGEPPPEPPDPPEEPPTEPPMTEPCVASDTTLCLNDSRFAVTTEWQTLDGTGPGQAESLTADTGTFWFFDEANVEVVVKVLDACDAVDRFWVFATGLTNVGVTLTVVDTDTGVERVYSNALDSPFAPIQDTSAFSTCP